MFEGFLPLLLSWVLFLFSLPLKNEKIKGGNAWYVIS